MLALGTKVPEFSLPDVSTGKSLSASDFSKDKTLLVMFISRHCPYVKHVQEEIARLGRDYIPLGVGMVAVCSNDVEHYPDDSPELLKEMAAGLKLNFPVCYDEDQAVAKSFRAACTPEFYLFDGARRLVYRGQLDDSRPKNGIPVTGRDLRAALDGVLRGSGVFPDQKPGIGCNIKWKPGNEPGYFYGNP